MARWFLFFSFLFAFVRLSGQENISLEAMPPKSIFNIDAGINYYWNHANISDSLPQIQKDHEKALSQGKKIDFGLSFNVAEELEIGFQYSYLFTSHRTEPVTVSVVYNGVKKLYQGTVYDAVYQNFYALRINAIIKPDNFFWLRAGIALGEVSYVHYADYAGFRYHLTGKTVGSDIRLEADYLFDYNWSVNVRAGLFAGIVSNPVFTDSLGNSITQNGANNSINLSNIYLGVGLRYTFNKKPGKHHEEHERTYRKEKGNKKSSPPPHRFE